MLSVEDIGMLQPCLINCLTVLELHERSFCTPQQGQHPHDVAAVPMLDAACSPLDITGHPSRAAVNVVGAADSVGMGAAAIMFIVLHGATCILISAAGYFVRTLFSCCQLDGCNTQHQQHQLGCHLDEMSVIGYEADNELVCLRALCRQSTA